MERKRGELRLSSQRSLNILISDYNAASGKYAEYFTPQALSSAIATNLGSICRLSEDTIYDIYDPSAGSGSLVLTSS